MKTETQTSDSVHFAAGDGQAKSVRPLPEVTRSGILSMQACVPEDYADDEAEAFANSANPTGSDTLRWRMRHNGDEALAGADERVKCEQRCGCVHIMFDC